MFDWGREWNREFSKQIGDQAVKTNVPAGRWLAAGKNRSKKNPAGEDRNFWNRNGPTYARNWADFLEGQEDWEPFVTPDGRPGIELFTEFLIAGTPIKAIPDRVYRKKTSGKLVIVDLKSGGRKPDAGYQLPIYQLAMDACFGEEVEEAFYFMNRTGELLPDHSPVEYSRDLMEWVLHTAIKTAEGDAFLPNPGSQCLRCSVKDACKVVGGSRA
jgi:CRISPR/Cas system-associated exonuclease Cas4 (RecB family)